MLHDRSCQCRPDSRQSFELDSRGPVDVDPATFVGANWGRSLVDNGDVNLVAVLEHGREVDPIGVRFCDEPTRSMNEVGDACSLGEPIHARHVDRTRDVNNDHWFGRNHRRADCSRQDFLDRPAGACGTKRQVADEQHRRDHRGDYCDVSPPLVNPFAQCFGVELLPTGLKGLVSIH